MTVAAERTLFEARGIALEKLAEQGYRLNWPGRLVARMTLAGNCPDICFAIPARDFRSSFTFDPNGFDPLARDYWKVCLEARKVDWRWHDRWYRRTDRLYIYSLTNDDFDAFIGFVKSGEHS